MAIRDCVSQLLFWDGKGASAGGWIYKSQPEWERETGLSRYRQLRVRRRLQALGVLEERLRGIPARLYYRLNLQALDALAGALALPQPSSTASAPSMGQDPELDRDTVPVLAGNTCPELACADATYQPARSPPAITENTTQITMRDTACPGPHDPAEVWRKATVELAASMQRRSYDCWIRPCTLVSLEEEGDGVHAVVEAPNEYTVEWLTSHLDVVVRRVLSGVLGRAVEVTYAQPGRPPSPHGGRALAGK